MLFFEMINWVSDIYSSLLMLWIFLSSTAITTKHLNMNTLTILLVIYTETFKTDTKASHSLFQTKVFVLLEDFSFQKIFICPNSSLAEQNWLWVISLSRLNNSSSGDDLIILMRFSQKKTSLVSRKRNLAILFTFQFIEDAVFYSSLRGYNIVEFISMVSLLNLVRW